MENTPENENIKPLFSPEAMHNIVSLMELLKQIRARLIREGIDINNFEEPVYPAPRKKRKAVIK